MIWFLAAVGGIAFLFFLLTFICYLMAFSVPNRHGDPVKDLPHGKAYAPHLESIHKWIVEASSKPYEEVFIKAKDGTRLFGRFYQTKEGAPLEIMFHGYRSYAMRDFCGGLALAQECGHNVLLVDQRAHGKSSGKCLTFGIKERYDCQAWAEYAHARFGGDTKIILSGLSMGAATVLMASSLPMPETVVGIIADCGYSSPKDIILKVLDHLPYPKKAAYFFVRFGGCIYGGFDIEACSATVELKKTSLPVLFLHGDADDFVPYEMSVQNHAACASEKYFLTVKGAGHGLCYTVGPQEYHEAVTSFIETVTK